MAAVFLQQGYAFIHRGDLRGDSYYVSDEVWYVTSARNLLYKVFGVQARYVEGGMRYWSLVFPNNTYIDEHRGEIRAAVEALGGRVARDNYTEAPLVWVAVPSSMGADGLRRIPGVVDVRGGYQYPDKSGIHEYLNLEHPPLGKYLIMLAMTLLGDRPASWRVPGLLEGAALVLVAYLVGWRLAGLPGGLIGVASVALDPIVYSMSRVAMLDIHLAFFTGLALLLVVYDRTIPALLAAGLASSVKFSGLFAVAAVYLYLRLHEGRRAFHALALAAVFPLLAYVAMGSPLMVYRGLEGWVQDHLGAFSWHTTSRPSGPPTSPPWGWLVNHDYVTLHYNPDILAVVNAPGYVLAAAASLFFLPLARRRAYAPALMMGSILLGYTLVFLRGNRTLYSFYAVQLSPAVAGVLASLAVLVSRDNVAAALAGWRRIAAAIVSGEARLPSELAWIRAFVPRRREARIPVLLVLSAVLASAVIQFYGMQAVPESPVLSLFREHEASILGGTPPLPYRDYVYNGPGLAAWLTYLSEIASGRAGTGGAYALYVALMVVAALSLGYDLVELGGGRPAYLFPLMLVFFGAYDWTLLAAALVLRAMLCFRDGRVWRASLLVGVASALNPIAALFALALLSAAPDYRVYLYALLGFAASNMPFMLMWPDSWASGTFWVCRAVGFGGLGNPLGFGCLEETVAAASLVMLAYYALTKTSLAAWFRGSILVFAGLLMLGHSEPQWLIPGLLIAGLRDWGHPEYLAVIDLLAALAALSWFHPDLVTGPLFKYHPASPLDPYSTPNLAVYAMLVAAIHLSAMIIHGYWRPRHVRDPGAPGKA